MPKIATQTSDFDFNVEQVALFDSEVAVRAFTETSAPTRVQCWV